MEVRYSVNGKHFKDFGVYVSESKGLLDKLEPKELKTYDWAEYNGLAVTAKKPRYKVRQISLSCFIIGDDWEQMTAQFIDFTSEFDKDGFQRILVEPFEISALVYDVVLSGKTEMEKKFRNGQMVGIFTIQFTEHNPVKKVLKVDGSLNLSFSTQKFTQIFWGDGTWTDVLGDAVFSNDFKSPIADTGDNLTIKEELYYKANSEQRTSYLFTADTVFTGDFVFWVLVKKQDDSYAVLGYAENVCSVVSETAIDDYKRIVYKITNPDGSDIDTELANAQIRQIAYNGNWYATGGTRYITIAGDPDEISNLKTNAEELWRKF